MVFPPQPKRILMALLLGVMVISGNVSDPAQAKDRASSHQLGASLGITAVRLSPDGRMLDLEATRPFGSAETRDLSVLKLPSPYRLVVDIPNARLATDQTLVPIGRNGVDRVELTAKHSPFYSAVRAIVYVQDGRILSQLATAFEGNSLHIEGLPLIAGMPAPTTSRVAPVPGVIQPLAMPTSGKVMSAKTTHAARPLPPVAQPLAQIAVIKQPPVPIESVVAANPPIPQTVLGTPLPPGASLIQDVAFRDNRLMIKAPAGAELHVKNRFTLSDPSRVVLDIDNAVLASKSLTNAISGNTDEIRQIRVGQFDEKTVRIVIEGDSPELFEAFYPENDKNLLAISPYSATSITRLSSNTRLGQVESIDLKRENGGTVLRLAASTPIVHRFMKRDDKVSLELLNEASHPSPIGFDGRQYPEILKMRLEPLTEGQPNSRLAITLANDNVRVVPSISDDGKIMELLLVGAAGAVAAGDDNAAPILGAAGKAPYPARIVIDAGHGGKDLGANRSGVNEKDLNLSLALMLRDALAAKGFNVYMTRSTDVFLPLPQITAITNQIRPDLFISVHHNASVNPAAHGIETYYYTSQSIALARRVHAREINAVGVKDGGVKRAMFYVIHHTAVPAILCEVGYVSNPNELQDLQTYDRKQKTARAIADGVVDYLKTRLSAKAK